MSGLLLAITPYVARLVNNESRGYLEPGNTTKLAITQPDPDVITRTSFLRESYGQALDSYSRPKPAEFEWTFDEADPDYLSMALLGVPANYSQAAGTGVNATVRVYHDRWVAIGSNHLSNAGITGKVEGEDYEIRPEAGLLKALSGGTIPDNSDVTVTFDRPARTGKEIVAGTHPTLQLSIYGDGLNLFTQEKVEIEIYKASVAPSGALEFISNEPVSLTLKGTLLVPSGRTGPYRYRVHKAA